MNAYPKEFENAIFFCCSKDLFATSLTNDNIKEIWDMAMRLLNKNQDCLDTQNGWNDLVYDAMIALNYELA